MHTMRQGSSMPNDASGSSESKDPQFGARLDAVYVRWERQILKELRAAYARKRRRRDDPVRPPVEVLKIELHKVELEIAYLREEIATANSTAADWEHKATYALNENREDLARKAVIKCIEYVDTINKLWLDVDILEAAAAEFRHLLVYFQRRDHPDATSPT